MEIANVSVDFCIQYFTRPGQDIYVLGNCNELGHWNVEKGVKLTWNNNHQWKGSTKLTCAQNGPVEYKYVLYVLYDANTKQIIW